jgi:hypothetical protein
MRKAFTTLGTRRLDPRSAVAIAAKQFKADLVRDLGGDVSRPQETVIELAARTWIIVETPSPESPHTDSTLPRRTLPHLASSCSTSATDSVETYQPEEFRRSVS